MKYIALSFLIAVIAILAGCANLPDLINPPRDSTVASTDAALVGAPLWVNRFLKYEEANPELMGMDARTAAEGLRKRFEGNLTNLKNAKAAYGDNRTDANQSYLRLALEQVLMDQAIAQGYLSGNTLPQRGQGAPFAPPMGIAPPGSPPTILDAVMERLDGIWREQASQRAELVSIREEQTTIRTNLSKVAFMVHSITNQTTEGNGTVTNKAPPLPK